MRVNVSSAPSVINTTLLLLALLVLGLVTNATLEALSDSRHAADELLASRASSALVRATSYRALERGLSLAALTESPNLDGTQGELLLRTRGEGDKAWAEGMGLAQSLAHRRPDDIVLAFEVQYLRQTSVRLAEVRHAVDQSLASGIRTITPSEFFNEVTTIIQGTENLRDSMYADGVSGHGGASLYQLLRGDVWRAAEFAGRQRAILAYYLSSEQPLSESDLRSLDTHQEGLLRGLMRLREGYGAAGVEPRVVKAIKAVEEGIESFLNLRREALESAVGDHPALSWEKWLARSTDFIERLNKVAEVCSAVIDESTAARQWTRDWMARGFQGLLLLSALLFVFAMTWVRNISSRLATEVAERRRVSSILQAYERIIASTPDHIALLGRDGRYRLVNDSYLRAHGIPAEEILGKSPVELLGRDVYETVAKAHFERALAGEVSHYESWFVFSVAGPRYMSVTYFPYRNAQGAQEGVVVSSRDITALKQVEEALAESEQELRLIADSMPGMLVRYGLDLRIKFFNKIYTDWFGLPHEGLIGKSVHEIPDKMAVDSILPNFELALHGETTSFEIVHHASDGGGRWIQVTLEPERGANQQVTGVIALGSDITERRGMEVQLRASQAGFRNVVNKNPIGIVLVDPEGRTLFTNPAAQKMLLSTEFPALPLPGACVEIEIATDEASRGVAEVTVAESEWEDAPAHLLMLHDVSSRKEAEARIESLAFSDSLTGLANRLPFHDRLEHALVRTRRSGKNLALLFLDIDHFKDVNDTLGHSVGDRLLIEMGSRLRQCVREYDTIARFGGDEFLVLLEDLEDPQQAEPVARKILAASRRQFSLGDQEFNLSASIGISLFPRDGKDAETLIRCADTAMYQAKAQGRDAAITYKPEFGARLSHRVKMESELRQALEHGEFQLHYQPQIHLQSGKVVGVEALLRWQHPERGLVPPGEFIPILEDAGLIVPVGEWVLHEAARQAASWHKTGLSELTVAVNISPKQLTTHQLLVQVNKTLDHTGIDPSRLELEITESTLMANPSSAAEVLRGLKSLGVKIAIDDFGTGYSSLSYLKQFAIDRLKIDRSFIRDIPKDPNDAVIVQAIIAMAHTLGLSTTAEGVETEAQQQFLRDHNCMEWQGFLFSRALPPTELVARLGMPVLQGVRENDGFGESFVPALQGLCLDRESTT